MDFNDDDLFEDLESDLEPKTDFDVAAVLRRVKKLEYKLEKQKAYKKDVELKLKLGVEKTDDAIDSLKKMVLTYMTTSNKTKLSFDDVGTVSVVNADKEDWILPGDKEEEAALVDKLLEMDIESAFKEREYKLDKKLLRSLLENNPELVKELTSVSWGKVDPHLTFRKK